MSGVLQMSTTHEACAQILLQALRITAQGKWHVFINYAGHVDQLTVRWNPADTDYSDTKRTDLAWHDFYLDRNSAESNLAAVKLLLDKLEQPK
jgi:hypothetical protein